MEVRQGTDESLIAAIGAAPRALVFLSVPWSCPERVARQDFDRAASPLSERSLGVECFLIDEETDLCQRWLSSLDVPQLDQGFPLGAGSVLWLEHGRVVASEVGGRQGRTVGIIARSKSLRESCASPICR